jgi:hypothetical protein
VPHFPNAQIASFLLDDLDDLYDQKIKGHQVLRHLHIVHAALQLTNSQEPLAIEISRLAKLPFTLTDDEVLGETGELRRILARIP